MAVVEVIPQKINKVCDLPFESKKKRKVAAYARVSTDSDEQFTSFEAQVDYYTRMIESNADWNMVRVYTDEGISGTNMKKRDGFNHMIKDALSGKIDLIITKSVSRFARNTVDSLTTIRKLKAAGVEVFFEKENIYTFDSKGELLITIMSSLAQEESRSISENVTWGIRKGFSDGKVSLPYGTFLGFDKGPDGRPKINEKEAEIIKKIYTLFLEGCSTHQIVNYLNAQGVMTPSKRKNRNGEMPKWKVQTVLSILKNEKYKGEAILQKTFTSDFLTHEKKKNTGQLPKYHVKNSHDAIIPVEEWEMVQVELERRANLIRKYSSASIFSTKLICGDCGAYYGQKVWHSTDKYRRTIFRCNHKFEGDCKCQTPTLTEEQIKAAFIKSFNIIRNPEILADCEIALEEINNTKALDEETAKLSIDAGLLVEMAKKMIDENATKEQDQEEYERKYAALESKHNAIVERLAEIEKEKGARLAAAKRIQMSMITFEKTGGSIEVFDPKLWTMLVESAVVTKDDTIKFKYYAGFENEVKID